MQSFDRRQFLRGSSVFALGFGLPLPPLPGRPPARADAVIQLHLPGGLSHLDSFDPKPDAPAEVRGPFGTVPCKGTGERFSDLLRLTAEVADKFTVVRSMTHTEADHDRGTHSMLTGYQPSPAIRYPGLGAVIAHELGGRNHLPAAICVPAANEFQGTGYLSAAYAPFSPGGNPAGQRFRVRDLDGPAGVDEARTQRRRSLLHDLDQHAWLRNADAVQASEEFYRQAYALLDSQPARASFDLAAEPDAMRDRYGRTPAGMSCLLARRLVAGGARYVGVNVGNYDHHARIAGTLPGQLTQADRAFAALIADLDAQGLLDRTLVLLTTEFGRTPRLNGDAGRDHWPRVFSIALAGGGIKRGHVHGSSNSAGADPETDAVRPADLAATVFELVGIDPTRKLMAPGDRPIDLVRDGRVLQELLA